MINLEDVEVYRRVIARIDAACLQVLEAYVAELLERRDPDGERKFRNHEALVGVVRAKAVAHVDAIFDALSERDGKTIH